jgi:Flp pilus assembly protein TadG
MVGKRVAAREDSGAAAVEFAVLFIIFVALVVGMITAGLSFNRKINMTQTSREVSRYAATLPVASAGNEAQWLQNVGNVAIVAGQGDLKAGEPGRYICIAKFDGTTWRRAVWNVATANGSPSVTAGSSCFTEDPVLVGRRVQVEVRRDTDINYIAGRLDFTVGSKSVSRFEPAT